MEGADGEGILNRSTCLPPHSFYRRRIMAEDVRASGDLREHIEGKTEMYGLTKILSKASIQMNRAESQKVGRSTDQRLDPDQSRSLGSRGMGMVSQGSP